MYSHEKIQEIIDHTVQAYASYVDDVTQEDLRQDLWVHYLGSEDLKSQPVAFLYTSFKNKLLDILYKSNKYLNKHEIPYQSSGITLPPQEDKNLAEVEIYDLIDQAPDHLKPVLKLAYEGVEDPWKELEISRREWYYRLKAAGDWLRRQGV